MLKYNIQMKKVLFESFVKFKILKSKTFAISNMIQLTFLIKPPKRLVGGACKKCHAHLPKRPYFIAKMSYCPVFKRPDCTFFKPYALGFWSLGGLIKNLHAKTC